MELIILLIALALNAVGDVFLLRGARETNYESGLAALEKTSDKDIRFGALLGLLVIPPWALILPHLSDIPGTAGPIAIFAWATYVAAVFAFHMSYAFVGPAIKLAPELKKPFGKLVMTIALYSLLAATVVSLALAWAGATGTLTMTWYHYATLPMLIILFFQAVLGRIFRRIPYFPIICGPMAMAVFFIAFYDMMRLNSGVFGVG
ncbi:MAG: hypothetical protein AAF950_13260 [Pseudomonadota bacterium]